MDASPCSIFVCWECKKVTKETGYRSFLLFCSEGLVSLSLKNGKTVFFYAK